MERCAEGKRERLCLSNALSSDLSMIARDVVDAGVQFSHTTAQNFNTFLLPFSQAACKSHYRLYHLLFEGFH